MRCRAESGQSKVFADVTSWLDAQHEMQCKSETQAGMFCAITLCQAQCFHLGRCCCEESVPFCAALPKEELGPTNIFGCWCNLVMESACIALLLAVKLQSQAKAGGALPLVIPRESSACSSAKVGVAFAPDSSDGLKGG